MKPLLVSSGEPAGIGPDLCLALAKYNFPVVILSDVDVLKARARKLKQNIHFYEYQRNQPIISEPGSMTVLSEPISEPVICGQLNSKNAAYVMHLLHVGAMLCSQKEFSGFVTAPVHKANINAAGIPFTGHTEFLADFFQVDNIVMMLASPRMRVALMTTHLPLRQVSDAITGTLIRKVVKQVHQSLVNDFGIESPKIKIAGLNPHAGESGYLGREEIEIIYPAIASLIEEGLDVQGPFPADTMFIPDQTAKCDAYIAMYHDQGLPVLKYTGFNEAVNVTLGLPIIRTSVDHGTALELAGKDRADSGSMIAAVKLAMEMAYIRNKRCH